MRISANGDYQDAERLGDMSSLAKNPGLTWPRAVAFPHDSGSHLMASIMLKPTNWPCIGSLPMSGARRQPRSSYVHRGCAMPHPPEYILNREGLDWREAVRLLAMKGVSCYAV